MLSFSEARMEGHSSEAAGSATRKLARSDVMADGSVGPGSGGNVAARRKTSADQGLFQASFSTVYRVLKQEGLTTARGAWRGHNGNSKPLCARNSQEPTNAGAGTSAT